MNTLSIDNYLSDLVKRIEFDISNSILHQRTKLATGLVKKVIGFEADIWGDVSHINQDLIDSIEGRLDPSLLPRVQDVICGEVKTLVHKLETQPESRLRQSLRKKVEESLSKKFDEMVEDAIDAEVAGIKEQVSVLVKERMKEKLSVFMVADQLRS